MLASPGSISCVLIMKSWGLCWSWEIHCINHLEAGPGHKTLIYQCQHSPLISRGRRRSFSNPCWRWRWKCLYYLSLGMSLVRLFAVRVLRNTWWLCAECHRQTSSHLTPVYVTLRHKNSITFQHSTPGPWCFSLFLVTFDIIVAVIIATLHCTALIRLHLGTDITLRWCVSVSMCRLLSSSNYSR